MVTTRADVLLLLPTPQATASALNLSAWLSLVELSPHNLPPVENLGARSELNPLNSLKLVCAFLCLPFGSITTWQCCTQDYIIKLSSKQLQSWILENEQDLGPVIILFYLFYLFSESACILRLHKYLWQCSYLHTPRIPINTLPPAVLTDKEFYCRWGKDGACGLSWLQSNSNIFMHTPVQKYWLYWASAQRTQQWCKCNGTSNL